MLENCPVACKACKNKCADHDVECVSWAKGGECSKNPEYMNIYCAKSCSKFEINAPLRHFKAVLTSCCLFVQRPAVRKTTSRINARMVIMTRNSANLGPRSDIATSWSSEKITESL